MELESAWAMWSYIILLLLLYVISQTGVKSLKMKPSTAQHGGPKDLWGFQSPILVVNYAISMFNISNKSHKLSVGCLTKMFWASDLDGNFPTLHYTKISQCKTHLTPNLTSAHAQMLGSVALLPWWWLTSCVTAMPLCNGWILTCCLLFPLDPSMWKSTS